MSKIDDAVAAIEHRMASIELQQKRLNRQMRIAEEKKSALSIEWLSWDVVKRILTRDDEVEELQ